jgi:hypothetical protein
MLLTPMSVNSRRKGPFQPNIVYTIFRRAALLVARGAEGKGRKEETVRLRQATFHTTRHAFCHRGDSERDPACRGPTVPRARLGRHDAPVRAPLARAQGAEARAQGARQPRSLCKSLAPPRDRL